MINSPALTLTINVDNKAAQTNLAAFGEAVKKLGTVTESTFAKQSGMEILGVKDVAAVKAEMAKLTVAYRSVADSGKASAADQVRALDALRTKQRELYATIGKPPKLDLAREVLGVSSGRSISAEIDRIRQAYATLASSGRASLADLTRAKMAMGQKIDELRQKTNNWRDSLDNIKGRLVEAAAASAGLVLAAKAGIDFESAMADVRKVVDGSPDEIAALGKELQKLSGIIPLSAVELAKIATAGGQLGVAAKDIVPFVEVTAKMATAFDLTADEAGNAIGKLMNVFQQSIQEIGAFGDAINQLGNNTAAKERDIVEVLLRVGGTSKQFGLAKERTAALAAAMLSLGKPAEVAATSINAMLNRLQTATMQEPKFSEALAKIGMTAEEMAQAVADNPQKALLDLLETLEKLDGREKSEVLTGLFGREFQDDIGVLVGSLGTYRKALREVAEENTYAGAMQKEFEARAGTTANKLTLLKNEIIQIATNIGTGLLPFIKAGAALLTALLKPISDLTGAFSPLAGAIAALATGAVTFNTLAKAAGILKSAMVIHIAEMVAKLRFLGTAITGLAAANPILAGLAAVAIAGGIAWSVFGKSSLQAAKDHAAAADALAKGRQETEKQVSSLERLQRILADTAPNSEAHLDAERELAKILPTANLSLDAQGRLLVKVGGAASENSKKLSEYINLLKEESRLSLALQLEQQAKAFKKAEDSLQDYKDTMRELYGIGAETDNVMLAGSRAIDRLIGRYDANVRKGEEVRTNLEQQRQAYNDLLQSMSRAGMTAEQVAAALDKAHVSAELKESILNKYRSLGKVMSDVADSAADSAGKQKDSFLEVTEDVAKAYKAMGDKVKKIQDDIAGREQSLAEQLREMGRSGMSDLNAWRDRKKEAAEFAAAAREAEQAAKDAFTAGDTATGSKKYEEAVALYDKASAAAADLNKEIRNGDTVIQSQQQSLAVARQLVEEYGQAGIETQKKFEQAVNDAGIALNNQTGGKLAKDLPEVAAMFGTATEKLKNLEEATQGYARVVVPEVGKYYTLVWDEAERKGVAMIKEMDIKTNAFVQKKREMEIDIKLNGPSQAQLNKLFSSMNGVSATAGYMKGGAIGIVQRLATGGQVFRNMLAGGFFPGFGGGDRRHVVAEDGEYMLNKFATREMGLAAATHANNRNWPALVKELIGRFGLDVGSMVRRATGGMINAIPVLPPMPQMLATGGAVSGGGSMPLIRHEILLRTDDGMRAAVYADDVNIDNLMSLFQRQLVMSS